VLSVNPLCHSVSVLQENYTEFHREHTEIHRGKGNDQTTWNILATFTAPEIRVVRPFQSFFWMNSFVIRFDPIPTQVTPASNHSLRFSTVGSTPPVGIMLVHGHGPFIAFTKSGPPTEEPGKIFTISAPSSSA
jgi:hypothetical protein